MTYTLRFPAALSTNFPRFINEHISYEETVKFSASFIGSAPVYLIW